MNQPGSSSLHPHGRGAAVIAREMWIEFGVVSFTFALVIGLLCWILWRRLHRDADPEVVADGRRPQRWLVLGGIVFPVVTLSVLFGWSVRDIVALRNPPTKESVRLEVIAHRWWWEVRYDNGQFATANYMVLPAGESVSIRLTSEDVIHSFWVPALGRKLDALPGQPTTMWLQAEDVGRYRGVCAEFCGLQHAHMQFIVDVRSKSDYTSWAMHERQDARVPTSPLAAQGGRIFVSQTCAYCHTIRGTGAHGWVGPDLTHLATRPELAAGTLPNTPGDLAAWIADPQHAKPGTVMPAAKLSPAQIEAVVAYLRSLR